MPICRAAARHEFRVVFERWPKAMPDVRGEQPFMVQRPLHPDHLRSDQSLRIQLLIDGTVAEAFIKEKITLVSPIYDHQDPGVSLFVDRG